MGQLFGGRQLVSNASAITVRTATTPNVSGQIFSAGTLTTDELITGFSVYPGGAVSVALVTQIYVNTTLVADSRLIQEKWTSAGAYRMGESIELAIPVYAYTGAVIGVALTANPTTALTVTTWNVTVRSLPVSSLKGGF